jgi:hypothetical protein
MNDFKATPLRKYATMQWNINRQKPVGYDSKTNKSTYVYESVLYTPYTSYMFRPLIHISKYYRRFWKQCHGKSPRHGASSGFVWKNGLRTWRVAVNTLNKQSRTADMGCPPAWGLGAVLTPHLKNLPCYDTSHKASDLDWFFGSG